MTELTTYNYRDFYNASLVLLEASSETHEQFEIEIKVLNLPKPTVGQSQLPRYVGLEVSSTFDPKELVLRNTFGALGPSSLPMLRLKFGAGSPQVVKIGWVDPTGVLVAVNKLQLNNSLGTEGIKLELKSPLR